MKDTHRPKGQATLRARASLGLFLAVSLSLSPALARAGELVFYDPDGNHEAIARISQLFNEYFRQSGLSLTFQPVQTREAFDKLLAQPTTHFVIVNANLLGRTGRALRPLLVPVAGGEVHYTKQLIDLGIGTEGNLSGRTIAASGVGSKRKAGEQLLAELRRNGLTVKGAIVAPVTKDIDALLALTFGQVEAAFVTANSVKVLSRINPGATARFRTAFESPPILRSPFCSVQGRSSSTERAQVTELIRGMGHDPRGKATLTMLGFDDWATFVPTMDKSGGRP